jgi:hypothetical protein
VVLAIVLQSNHSIDKSKVVDCGHRVGATLCVFVSATEGAFG